MGNGGSGTGVVTEIHYFCFIEILLMILPGVEFLSWTEDTVGPKDNPEDCEFCPLLTGSVLS